MPKQVFAALYRAFEQVPQQILWYCAERRMPFPLPRNVKCVEWIPQLSVLCKYRSFFSFLRAGLNVERSLFAKVAGRTTPRRFLITERVSIRRRGRSGESFSDVLICSYRERSLDVREELGVLSIEISMINYQAVERLGLPFSSGI